MKNSIQMYLFFDKRPCDLTAPLLNYIFLMYYVLYTQAIHITALLFILRQLHLHEKRCGRMNFTYHETFKSKIRSYVQGMRSPIKSVTNAHHLLFACLHHGC
jgi:hypothetical protein